MEKRVKVEITGLAWDGFTNVVLAGEGEAAQQALDAARRVMESDEFEHIIEQLAKCEKFFDAASLLTEILKLLGYDGLQVVEFKVERTSDASDEGDEDSGEYEAGEYEDEDYEEDYASDDNDNAHEDDEDYDGDYEDDEDEDSGEYVSSVLCKANENEGG